MGVIAIPAHVPAFQALDSTPAEALVLATDLRAVAVGVKDVQAWAEGVGAPGWEGDTAAAHDHAATRFAVRVDGAEAALERAVVAADRFEARLRVLHTRRTALDAERKDVNADAEALRAEVEAAGASPEPATVAAWQARGERLTGRAAAVSRGIDAWVTRYRDAEQDFVAALQGVDTVREGVVAATDPARVDAEALTRGLLRRLDDPAALAAWWGRLGRAERQVLGIEHPHLVGNAGGIPAADRDEVNRAAVRSDIDRLEEREADGQLTGDERSLLENARLVRHAMAAYADHRDPLTGRELVHLLGYQPGLHSGDGGVAISFGDPDTADHVSVNVPGLTSETSSTEGNLAKTLALHRAVQDLEDGTVASVYWLGYDAPSGNPLSPWEIGDVGGVVLDAKAEAGGEQLATFLDGLRASDDGPAAHLTAIGHSYGSTTLGHALTDGAVVDDAVVIGSPGQPASSAEELTSADVWVGSKDRDPVTLLGSGERGGIGALGHDPAEDDFGGTRFATGDGSLRVGDLLGNHTSYFEGTSLDNMARIVADLDAEVTTQPHRGDDGGEYLTLPELLAAASAGSAGDWIQERTEDAVDLGEWLLEHSRVGGIL